MSLFGIPLDSERINSALKDSYWRVVVVKSTGSTQNDLTSLTRANQESHGAVIVTEYQSAGRGRLDRSFTAESGTSLLFSLYVTPSRSNEDWGWLPLLAGQAICAAIVSIAQGEDVSNPMLKWPNDILINDLKVAGILSERVESTDRVGVVIGIGINVNSERDQLPIAGATSLFLQGFGECDRSALLVAILESFGNLLKRWEEGDLTLIDDYRSISATIGQMVRVELPGGATIESEAVSIADSGALILSEGREIMVGDVVHLRTK